MEYRMINLKKLLNEAGSYPSWHQPITDKDIPGYEKVANDLIKKIGPVTNKVVKKYNTKMGMIKAVVSAGFEKINTNDTKTKISPDGMKVSNIIDNDTVNVYVWVLSPSQRAGTDSNIDAVMYIGYKGDQA
jgi:ABC-type molybdenum transport system ATPase subunit/photorepair protein PhrA